MTDLLLGAVTVLRAVLDASGDTDAQAATVGTRVPFTVGYPNPALPYFLVSLTSASSRDRWGTDERATVAVSVWTDEEAAAYSLARLAYSALLAYPGGSSVRAFRPVAGPIPTTDPESGGPLSTFTVEALARPS